MRELTCVWSGCSSDGEAALERRSLWRNHFRDFAAKRLEEYRERVQRSEPTRADRNAILKFLSELIGQVTNFVAKAKFLSPAQRDQFFELSLFAAELYKRIQRNPRIPRNMPILVCREADYPQKQELTNTINVSKRGACIATIRLWEAGEKIWIEKPGRGARAPALIARVKKDSPSQFQIGVEILGSEDSWGLEVFSTRKTRS